MEQNEKNINDKGYKIRNKEGIHFITFAVIEWVDVFTRKDYRDIVLESIKYCQAEKGLILYAWCLMSNHVHLVVAAKNNDTSDILRDFKKFTGKKIIKAIQENNKESRREWMLNIFKQAGEANSRNSTYQFWRQENHPKELFSSGFTVQKLNYIHNNPVESGIVEKAEDYLYSSARDYERGKKCGLLEVEWI
jgi:REP element-mobilizing transposase RayT